MQKYHYYRINAKYGCFRSVANVFKFSLFGPRIQNKVNKKTRATKQSPSPDKDQKDDVPMAEFEELGQSTSRSMAESTLQATVESATELKDLNVEPKKSQDVLRMTD